MYYKKIDHYKQHFSKMLIYRNLEALVKKDDNFDPIPKVPKKLLFCTTRKNIFRPSQIEKLFFLKYI